jgi:hypothetical protein
MDYSNLPIEVSIGGVYFPPILLASVSGVLLAWCVTRMLNRFGLAQYIWHPPLFFLALAVICTGLVSFFILPV